ncbi:interactor of constitutive active rops 1 [Striga asiatica]|uniref:Interactor of constitutive active rops 1 n=1 Tax=Striga asiatica TaxID=4170 RepID=A0A5A7R8M0_STRAF|nr:interactor of constitutive active rops 1 [Striga asiatica]
MSNEVSIRPNDHFKMRILVCALLTETAQRQSPRGLPNARVSSSDSDQPHPRPRTEKNQKPIDGRSAKPSQSEPSNQKKLGTRIANLESQLGLAQEELKSLKDQLVSKKPIKKAAQDQFDNKPKQTEPETVKPAKDQLDDKPKQIEPEAVKKGDSLSTITQETSVNNVVHQEETDVFEVPVEILAIEPESPAGEDEFNSKSITESEKPLLEELITSKDDGVSKLKAELDEKDKELEAFRVENESLKSQLDNKSLEMSTARAEIDGLTLRLTNMEQELERSKKEGIQVSEKLESVEKVKEEMESEMRRLRVLSEQWRKAADEAAAVLAGGRLPERCGSMDKAYMGPLGQVGGYGGYMGSPGLGDDEDGDYGFSGERRKGPGIRMPWKKKGPK